MNTRCADIQEWLSAYLDGEIDAGRREEIAAHLDGCAACRHALAELQRVHACLPGWPVPEVAPDLGARLSARLAARPVKPAWSWRGLLRPGLAWAGAAAAGAALVCAGIVMHRPITSPARVTQAIPLPIERRVSDWPGRETAPVIAEAPRHRTAPQRVAKVARVITGATNDRPSGQHDQRGTPPIGALNTPSSPPADKGWSADEAEDAVSLITVPDASAVVLHAITETPEMVATLPVSVVAGDELGVRFGIGTDTRGFFPFPGDNAPRRYGDTLSNAGIRNEKRLIVWSANGEVGVRDADGSAAYLDDGFVSHDEAPAPEAFVLATLAEVY